MKFKLLIRFNNIKCKLLFKLNYSMGKRWNVLYVFKLMHGFAMGFGCGPILYEQQSYVGGLMVPLVKRNPFKIKSLFIYLIHLHFSVFFTLKVMNNNNLY